VHGLMWLFVAFKHSAVRYFFLCLRNMMLMVWNFSKKPSALSKPHIEMIVKPSRKVSLLRFLCSQVW